MFIVWMLFHTNGPHTSSLNQSCNWFCTQNLIDVDWCVIGRAEKIQVLLKHSRWIEETSAVCTECTIHLSAFPTLTLSPPCVCPFNPPAKHTPLYSSCWLARKTVTSAPVLCHHLAPQKGVVALRVSAWCLHVCLWVGCHTSVCGELIGMAAVRADTNPMCQVGGNAWAAITFTEKQVTLTEVMLLQWVGGLNKWHRHWGTERFTRRLTQKWQWSDRWWCPEGHKLNQGSIFVLKSQRITSMFVFSLLFTSSVNIHC